MDFSLATQRIATNSSLESLISSAATSINLPLGKNTNTKDASVLQALLDGDTTIFNRLYQEYLPSIQAYIRKNNGSDDDARDIFQEAITLIYQKLHAGTIQIHSSLHALVFQVCKYMWLNVLKKKYRTEVSINAQPFSFEDESDIVQDIFQQERKALFQEKFQQLSEDQQELLKLCFEGKNHKEIAEIMGYGSANYVKKKKFFCKKKLIELIQADSRYEEVC